jgi:hypothetical protein
MESIPKYYVDISLYQEPSKEYGSWLFVDRIVFDSDSLEECVKEADRRILGGVMDFSENNYKFTKQQLIDQAEHTKNLQANSGLPDRWNLPEFRAKNILPK